MTPPRIDTSLIPVRLPDWTVVLHTREEYARLWENVDREAARQNQMPLEPGEETE